MSNLSTLFDRYKALVVFDTETSGLDFDSDQIIELAALRVERTATGGLRIAGKMDTFIKLPEGETLPENIVSLTGITDERLQTEGVQPVKAAGQIAKLMQNGPTLMIAHNAQFDACFLRGLLRGQKVGRIDWLDSLTVYKDRRAYPHKLANAIIAYDLTDKVRNSHRAIDDVLALFEVLKAMDDAQLQELLDRALSTDAILRERHIEVRETGALFGFAGGDARKLLNILDIVAGASDGDLVIDDRTVTDALQQNIATYDKNGEMHYDIISAFIKSVRGSDPNAAVYYLARMLNAGEDPKFIARRLVILAAEDIGLANPNGLLLANACFDTVHKIGMPEARIPLAEATIYLATSPKSNSAYMAIDRAMGLAAKDTNNRPVPLHIRNAPTKLMKELDYGKNYKYAHDFEGNFAEQEFMPAGLEGRRFYEPGNNPKEAEIARRIASLWKGKY